MLQLYILSLSLWATTIRNELQSNNSNTMKRSQVRNTPDKSRTLSKSRLTSPRSTPKLLSELYYCHYKNAMYMGGIKSYKKEGRGIILHDNGVSMLTSHYNDLLHGHNVLFDNCCLLSAVFNKNKITQAAFRTQGFLIFLTYNQENQLQGDIKLVNFITKSIAYATFRKGTMIDKYEERELDLINRVFQLGELELVVGRTHAKVFKYQFEKFPNIQIIKHANKLIVGFQKNGFLNGLGFQFVYKGNKGGFNPDTHRYEDDFQLKMIQRGYYINTQLNGMGSKMFKNGNLYIGEFKGGLFQGNGILKNSEKKNWVSGFFKGGNLAQLLQHNSDGNEKNVDRIVAAMHERKTNWINNEIASIDMNFYVDQIETIITTEPNKNVHQLQQRKQEVLRRIQEKFVADSGQSFSAENDGHIHNLKSNSAGNSSVARFVNSLSPADTNRQVANSDAKQNVYTRQKVESKRLDEELREKKSKSITTKTKVFERSATQKTQLRTENHQESHINKKFVHSPGWIKANDDVFSSRKIDQDEEYAQNQTITNVSKFQHPLPKSQFNNSRQLRVEQTPPSSYQLSSQQVSFSNKNGLDSKRMVAKSKIFKFLQSQSPPQKPPQFNNSVYRLESTQRNREARAPLVTQRPKNR